MNCRHFLYGKLAGEHLPQLFASQHVERKCRRFLSEEEAASGAEYKQDTIYAMYDLTVLCLTGWLVEGVFAAAPPCSFSSSSSSSWRARLARSSTLSTSASLRRRSCSTSARSVSSLEFSSPSSTREQVCSL